MNVLELLHRAAPARRPIVQAGPRRGGAIREGKPGRQLKGARDSSAALNGKYDEPKSIPERDDASVAPGQRRRSLRDRTKGPGVSEPEWDAFQAQRRGYAEN
jgi:hypothetical protein